MLGGDLAWNVLAPADPWSVSFGAGIAAALVQTQGDATPPFVTSSGSAWTAVPFAAASAGRALGSPRVRFAVQLLAGVAASEIAVRFVGRDTGMWGAPIFGMSAGLQIALQ